MHKFHYCSHKVGKNYDKKSPTLIYLQWMHGVQKRGTVCLQLGFLQSICVFDYYHYYFHYHYYYYYYYRLLLLLLLLLYFNSGKQQFQNRFRLFNPLTHQARWKTKTIPSEIGFPTLTSEIWQYFARVKSLKFCKYLKIHKIFQLKSIQEHDHSIFVLKPF